MIKTILTAVLYVGLCLLLKAQNTYYVSSSGSNTNNGSQGAPFRTIQYAVDKVVPGDVVLVMNGVYNEKVRFSNSGTAGNYITLSAMSGHNPVIDGASGTVLTAVDREGLISIIDQSYIKVIGFEVRNFSASGNNTPVGIYIEGESHDIEIRNNKVHNISGDQGAHGIAIFGVSEAEAAHDLTFDRNEVYDCSLFWSEAFVLNGNVRNFTVTNNSVHDCDNIGFDFIGYEGECSGCTGTTGENVDRARNGYVGYNVAYNIDTKDNLAYGGERSAAGFYVDGGDSIVFEGNISHDCNLGIELASEHYGKATSNIVVRNNVFYNNHILGIATGGYSAGTGAGGGQADNCIISNNTLYHNNNSIRSEDKWGAEILLQNRNINNTYQNNIIIANNYPRTSIGSLNSGIVWDKNLFSGSYTPYDIPSGSNSIFGDPGFKNAGSYDFELTTGSIAIDQGITSSSSEIGTSDFNKNTRVVGAVVDIGAFEYNSVLGIEEIVSGDYSSDHAGCVVFPNPAEDRIFIFLKSGNSDLVEYKIVDAVGKIWKANSFSGQNMMEVLINHLPPQMYFLILQYNDHRVLKSFVKK